MSVATQEIPNNSGIPKGNEWSFSDRNVLLRPNSWARVAKTPGVEQFAADLSTGTMKGPWSLADVLVLPSYKGRWALVFENPAREGVTIFDDAPKIADAVHRSLVAKTRHAVPGSAHLQREPLDDLLAPANIYVERASAHFNLVGVRTEVEPPVPKKGILELLGLGQQTSSNRNMFRRFSISKHYQEGVLFVILDAPSLNMRFTEISKYYPYMDADRQLEMNSLLAEFDTRRVDNPRTVFYPAP